MSVESEPPQPDPVINLSVIEELRGLGGDEDPGLVLELIETFLDDAPRHRGEMIRAHDEGDLVRMQRAAHTLKSSSASMGSIALRQLCREMEAAAREGDAETYHRLTDPCHGAFRNFVQALRAVE